MIIPADLLNLLRCPATGQTLAQADAALLAQVTVRRTTREQRSSDDGKATGVDGIGAALVRADRKLLFPIRDGIPILLMEEAISL